MLTLSYDGKNLPKDKFALEITIKKFRTFLINYAKINNIEIKFFISIEFGEKTKRLHIHVIVPRHGIPIRILKEAWPYGKVYFKSIFRKYGSFRLLAEYLLKSVEQTRDMLGIKKTYRHHGLKIPPKETKVISETEMYSIPQYDGYRIDWNRSYYGFDDFGHPYAHYELIKRKNSTKCEQAYSEGVATGQADGFCQYFFTISGNSNLALCAPHSSVYFGIHKAIYNAGYRYGFKLGQQKAFSVIVSSPFYHPSSGRMFFDGVSYKGYLRIGRYYRYIDNTIYYFNGVNWTPADFGVLYSINQDGTMSQLPDGIYSSYGGRNHFRPIYSQNLSVLNPFAPPHNNAIYSAS